MILINFQCIRLLSNLGITVGPSAVSYKQNELVGRQKDKIKNTIGKQVEQQRLLDKIGKAESVVSLLEPNKLTDSEANLGRCPTDRPYFEKIYSPNAYVTSSIRSNLTVTDSKLYLQSKKTFDHVSTCTGTPYFSGQATLATMSQATTDKTLQYCQSFLENNKDSIENLIPTFEIIGDNIDITKSPSQMSKDSQRKSYHWFLNLAVQRRVFSDLPDHSPVADIATVPNSVFLPNVEDLNSLDNNMQFHMLQVMVKHIDCLKPFATSVPKFIDHPYVTELSKKSEYMIVDLLDKSENKTDEMISILEHVHEHYIAHTEDDPPLVVERKVFGGDVLTNERAYSAQLAMMNCPSDFSKLSGVIHRPEGLHRMMNFLLVSQRQIRSFNNVQKLVLFNNT